MEPRHRLVVLIAAAVLIAGTSSAGARALLTQKQALALAFPNGELVERKTAYLTNEQRAKAQQDGQVRIEQRVWTYYVGRGAAAASYAYFDTHVVRTMPETLMVALDSGGQVRFVEVLSFLEPDDYLPNKRWLSQFERKRLKDDLVAHRGVRNLGGASLTSQAAADAVRRVLAVHAQVQAQSKAP